MLQLGDTEYPICLLDTLAVSELVKRPAEMFRNYLEWSAGSEPTYVPAFTVYTLIELRRRPDLFTGFVEMFDPFACLLLKGYMNFLDDEVAAYPHPETIDPCILAFTPLGDEGNLLRNLPRILELPALKEQQDMWLSAGPEIVEGMVSLVANYPPAGSKYTPAETRLFVDTASLTQIILHGYGQFAERVHATGEAVDIDAFPSLKAMTYTVFHKFYADTGRQSSSSDAFDVLIAAALPYVEAVITENHLAEALRKTKRRDAFLEHLKVFTLRDLRAGLAG